MAGSQRSTSPEAARRVTATYSGRVQGVGFRYTVVRLAEGYPDITGYVANQYDGTVLLEAEAGEDRLRHLLGDIQGSALGRYIEGVQTVWGPASGGFSGFTVRYL